MAYGSSLVRSAYYQSPSTVKNLFASIYGIQQRRERYGEIFQSSLAFLRISQFWDLEKLSDYQSTRTIQFVERAIRQTPYYQSHPEYAAFLRHKDFARLPLLPKATVRSNLAALYSTAYNQNLCRWAQTSGTTGQAIRFPLSRNSFEWEHAFRALHYEWGGVDLVERDRVAFCAGHPVASQDRSDPPFWVYDWANNWLYLSSYHLSGKNLRSYIAELDRFKPLMIGGYPSSVYLLALAYKRYGNGSMKLKSVNTSSETLLPHQRSAIEEIFGVPVFNWYGNTEQCANIVSCEMGELHLKLEHSYVEIIGGDNLPARPGETGRLVCTGFGNDAFPLVRYDIGDTVVQSERQQCKCGRGGIIVDRILGRVEEYIVTPDGRMVGRLDHLFKASHNVIEAQIVQDRADEITLRIVKTEEYRAEDEEALRHEAALRLGSTMKLKFEYPDAIQRDRHGKFKFIVSHIDQKKMLNQITGQSPATEGVSN